MQSVAAELRMPATAFVLDSGRLPGLRWFTTTSELEICGHGTLAAAHVLWEIGVFEPEGSAEFASPAGTIGAFRDGSSIFLQLPAGDVVEASAPPGLIESVGQQPQSVWRTPLDYLLVLETADAVEALTPDPDGLARIETRGVIVTATGGMDGTDFTSRFFAPRIGIPEDSVTGSAHASLGRFWAKRLEKGSLRARQASARGGFVELRVDGDRVDVGGAAVTVARGRLVI